MRFYNISAISILIIATSVIVGCSGSAHKEEGSNSDHLIIISHEQFKAEQMQIGSTVMHPFKEVFKTNGIITASPQAKADIYSYIPGIVKSISVNIGSYIKKGQELCTIESNEFINIQQQYLESLAKFKATESDYQRIKTLYKEKISSKKDFIAIESEYLILTARIKALKAELKILNVDLKNLEDGNLETYLPISSPIQGFITSQNCNLGEFVDSQKPLMEIIDNNDLQLHFFVFQETVGKLHTDQMLNIYSPDNSNNIYKGKIISIGKSIDPETKSIKCIAELLDNDAKNFIPGMYLQVEIKTSTLNAIALPSEAIISSGNKNYVLVKEKQDSNSIFFKKEEVSIGIISNGFTEITRGKNLNEVLIKGAYYYQAE